MENKILVSSYDSTYDWNGANHLSEHVLLIKAQELVIALNLVIGPEDHTKYQLPMRLQAEDLSHYQDSKL